MYELEIAGHWNKDKDARSLEDPFDASGEGTVGNESTKGLAVTERGSLDL